MLAQLLTPLLIATAPMTVIVPENNNYSHETQMSAKSAEEIYQQRTWNGTQTFDWQGRPNDSDND